MFDIFFGYSLEWFYDKDNEDFGGIHVTSCIFYIYNVPLFEQESWRFTLELQCVLDTSNAYFCFQAQISLFKYKIGRSHV
jgi:hypothetical protein